MKMIGKLLSLSLFRACFVSIHHLIVIFNWHSTVVFLFGPFALLMKIKFGPLHPRSSLIIIIIIIRPNM